MAATLFGLDLVSQDLVKEIEMGRLTFGGLIEDRVEALGDEAEATRSVPWKIRTVCSSIATST